MSDIDEVEEVLDGVSTATILLTVRTANGSLQTVTLYKQAVKLEENLIKSYILEGAEKIGYISLPDFYTDWNSYNALGCANDVAKEIIKLKKENIQGLILDLRFNGGGSMLEAAGLAGIFINEGPLCVMDEADKPKVLKDPNRGTAYDGPLLVLVNTLSASASEFTAAVLQDYNRALIVGSPTYGKASMQIVMPVDTSAATPQAWAMQKAELGYLKITEGGFYRVTGKSHQRNGIQPDIHLPDVYEKMHIREEDEPQALYFDTVSKKPAFARLPDLPLQPLAQNSANRIKAGTAFKNLMAVSDSIYRFKENVPVALTPASITLFKEQTNNLYKTYDRLTTTPIASFKVTTHSYQTDLMKEDEYSRELNKRIADDMASDIYIDEAYRILADLIKLEHH